MQFGTGTRAAVDDRLTILPRTLLHHHPRGGLDPEEHGLQVDREDPIVVRLGDLEEGGDVLDAGIVDERVELAEVRHRPLHHRAELGHLRHVDRRLRHPAPRLVADERRRLGHERRVDVRQREVAPLFRQAQRGGASDAPAGSRDQRHPALETHARLLLWWWVGTRPASREAASQPGPRDRSTTSGIRLPSGCASTRSRSRSSPPRGSSSSWRPG